MKTTAALLSLPALALAASISPRQDEGDNFPIKITAGKVIGNPNGCPAGSFGFGNFNFGAGAQSTFDKYAVYSNLQGVQRELSCDFELTLDFPLGCWAGTLEMIYHGDIGVEQPGLFGNFHADYTLEKATTGPNPADLRLTHDEYPKETNYTRFHAIDIGAEACNANEREFKFRTNSRIFLNAPGPDDVGYFSVFDAHVQVRNAVRVPCKRANCPAAL
ncbi:hypothetical protein QBC42DRAFT_289256 [Cladorrhinum samala]|uniref:Secreted protein n=1 Tax=Cladorrhinum samala TaxID=585594 RepID=A0AAV9HIR7_9PEZI|nr:hypothetical protein QBC42DRAFT_289256 [Cladorrhinum samala]